VLLAAKQYGGKIVRVSQFDMIFVFQDTGNTPKLILDGPGKSGELVPF